jgi:hypothetical protein
MKTVEQEQDARPGRGLPPGIQDALGELAGAAKDGLLALSVGVGLGVLREMMEAELDEIVGPKHAKISERTSVRHGHTDGESPADTRSPDFHARYPNACEREPS